MKLRKIILTLGVATLLVASGLTAAENESSEEKFQATCPVSGHPAVETSALKLPKNGGTVYFCCDNCPKAYAADPEKFETKVHRQLLETKQVVQVACPLSGQPVSSENIVEFGTTKVGFCCENCLAKFNAADDDGKLKIAFADLEKGFTNQTKCPVSGKPIKAEFALEHDSKKVYFCCPNCPTAFKADPQKFIAKLPQFAKDDGEAAAK